MTYLVVPPNKKIIFCHPKKNLRQIKAIKRLVGFIIHIRHTITWPNIYNNERDLNNNYEDEERI